MSQVEKQISEIKVYSNFYNEMILLRGLISVIPYVGPLLDYTFSMPGQKFVEERLEFLINELHNEMKEVKEAIIENRFLDTEEGYDLIQRTFVAAARTRQKEKLKLFAKVLRGAYTKKDTVHDPELYVKIVDELSERELEAAILLYSVKLKRKSMSEEEISPFSDGIGNDPYWFSKYYPQFSKEELEYILLRLAKTGLFKEQTGAYMGNTGYSYNATSLLSSFINYIEKND